MPAYPHWQRIMNQLIELQMTSLDAPDSDQVWDLRLEGKTLTLIARDSDGTETARIVLIREDGTIRISKHE